MNPAYVYEPNSAQAVVCRIGDQMLPTLQKTFGDLAPGTWVVMGNDLFRVALVRPNNGIVEVHLYRGGHTSLESLMSMSALAAFHVTILDQQSEQGIPMNNINEVRERLAQAAEVAATYGEGDDLRALLADHEKLQADAERLDWLEDVVRHAYVYGASFGWAKPCEGEPGGFRFMTRHRIDARQPTLRAAIDAAKETQP